MKCDDLLKEDGAWRRVQLITANRITLIGGLRSSKAALCSWISITLPLDSNTNHSIKRHRRDARTVQTLRHAMKDGSTSKSSNASEQNSATCIAITPANAAHGRTDLL
jgi:hypothetical protein